MLDSPENVAPSGGPKGILRKPKARKGGLGIPGRRSKKAQAAPPHFSSIH